MFDVHSHLQRAPLLRAARNGPIDVERVRQVLRRAREASVEHVVVCGVELADWDDVELVSSQFPDAIIPHFGIHPWWAHEVGDITTVKEKLRERLHQNPGAHVGEIGLDKLRTKACPMDKQRELFRSQLQVAQEFNRVSSCHCVQASGLIAEDLRAVNHTAPIVLHSFNGPKDMIQPLMNACPHVYFSIGTGVKAEKIREALGRIPRERLVVESDAPDRPPKKDESVDQTGWFANEPACVPWVVSQIAEVLGESVGDIERITGDNARKLYGVKRRPDHD